ncbi:MAG TPA: MogA/MoaB family molybdenum cofactor biosynthesis protein [Methanospirillum sp.]|nr:MogA/MoaB family molybdenum cofactor biosynthesis protein [Methanospirillum sp.]
MDPSHIQDVSIVAGILTISTSRSGKEDKSGVIIQDLLREAGIPVEYTAIIPDQITQIRSGLIKALETCSCVILTGGTGITHDDCTIEAVAPLFEKTLDGFGELFRMKSFAEVGTRVILSRAAAGLIGKKVVFCIPGSTNAATLATRDIIIPEVRHILTHANR